MGKRLIPTHNSTLGIFYVTWLMGREPDKANVMSGHSDKLTKGFFKECLDILSDPDYLWHDVFPKAKVVAVSSEDESISVNHKRRFTYPDMPFRNWYADRCGGSRKSALCGRYH